MCNCHDDVLDQLESLKQMIADLKPKPKAPPKQICPYSEIINLYHRKLPELPRVIKLTEQRKRALNRRWLEGMNNLGDWESYFEDIRASEFLMGKAKTWGDRKKWKADFDWAVSERAIVRVQEGKYH